MIFEKSYFMIGIGGIGMSAIATHLVENGAQVWGYDREKSKLTEKLAALGAEIIYDDRVEALPEAARKKSIEIIYTAAIPKNHPQWCFYQKQGNPMQKRAAFLGKLSNQTHSIAVGGTHGKTTTTALLTHILLQDGRQLSAFIGGVLKGYNTNYISTGTDLSILEADEYDRSFLQLYPTHAAITAMDADHLDIYESSRGIEVGYEAFAAQVQKTLVVAFGLPLNGVTYGFDPKADYHIENIQLKEGGFEFDVVTPHEVEKNLYFNQMGQHNLQNALCALTLARVEGVSFEVIRKGLASFPGIERRLNQYALGERILIDDYAHHPVELKALLETVKSFYPNRKNTIVFQPHLFSRTRDFMTEFAAILSQFDAVILLDIYPARELPMAGITSATLLAQISNVNKKLVNKEALADTLASSNADLIVMAGAGDIGLEIQKLISQLNPIT